MREIVSSPDLVAYCGLYCGACKAYLKDKCSGCHDNHKATWCKVRSCCISNDYTSCAECKEFDNPNQCKMFNTFVSRLFGVIFRSDRAACIRQIRELGIRGHAANMTEHKRQTIRKHTTAEP